MAPRRSFGNAPPGHEYILRGKAPPEENEIRPASGARRRLELDPTTSGKWPVEIPAHVRPFANYMRGRGTPTKRDILKAYLITMSSIQRQAISRKKVCELRPNLSKLKLAEIVRPEDLFSQLLGTPAGKAYLDDAVRGEYNRPAAREIAEDLRCFGLVFAAEPSKNKPQGGNPEHGGLFKNVLPYAVNGLLPHSEEIAALVSPKVSREQAYKYVEKNIKGIKAAKTGVFLSLLGRGDIPTFDAKEIDIWVTEWPQMYKRNKDGTQVKPVIAWKDVQKLTDRFHELPFRMPKEDRKNRMHLQHHAIWDAAANSETTHQDIIDAMNLAGARRRKHAKPRYRIVSR